MKDRLLNPKLIELEGMAMVGQVKKVSMEPCEDSRFPKEWKRLRAILEDGTIYETGCMDPESAKRNYMVLSLYIRNWSKDIVIEKKE
ncbi:MAG: hypothetical protein F7C36_01205 [Desulfurococcales archaeon]|nr:hypothetical protein [Desulfurococcales archaeon]